MSVRVSVMTYQITGGGDGGGGGGERGLKEIWYVCAL